jgi:hypothetical protein
MDEQLKSKLLGYLDGLEKSASKLSDSAVTEIPLTVQEWLQWQAIYCFGGGVLWLGMMMAGLAIWYTAYRFIRWLLDQKEREDDALVVVAGIVAGLIGTPLLCVGLVHAIWSFSDGVKVVVAPRVVILEKVAELTGVTKNAK